VKPPFKATQMLSCGERREITVVKSVKFQGIHI